MKKQLTSTNYVPSFRTQSDTNTLMQRYFKKLSILVCRFKKNMHLCSDFHLIQASRLAIIIAAGIFYAYQSRYSSVPCGALMRPQPVSGVEQRGAELFLFPSVLNQHNVSF